MHKTILAISFLIAVAAFGIPHAFAHHVLEQIPVGQSPMKMSFDGQDLFVSSLGGNQVNVINTKTSMISDNITTSSGVAAVEAIPKVNKIYVATFESGGIDVYSLSSKSYERTIPLPNSKVTFYQSPNLDRPGVTLLTGGSDLAYNPVNGLLYVANYNADYVAVIDPTTDQVLQSIPVAATPFSLKVDFITGTILVASLAGNGVTFITPSVDHLTGKLSHDVSDVVKTGIGPWGIAIDSDKHRAYITNRGSNTITVLDTITHQVIQQIPISGPAHAITVDSGEHKVYASYLKGNNIVKIDGLTNAVESTIDIGGNSWDIVADSNTHNVFASIKDQNKVIVLGPQSMTSEVQVITIQLPVAAVGSVTSHGQDVDIRSAYLDIDNKKLSLSVVTLDGGQADITIPRYMIDSKQDGTDSSFQVLIDGKPVKFDEAGTTDSQRTISLFVPKGTLEIDVVGTNAIPEFGPLAAIVMVSSIVIGLVISKRLHKPSLWS
jgi:YVTN family beta-propeller protein